MENWRGLDDPREKRAAARKSAPEMASVRPAPLAAAGGRRL